MPTRHAAAESHQAAAAALSLRSASTSYALVADASAEMSSTSETELMADISLHSFVTECCASAVLEVPLIRGSETHTGQDNSGNLAAVGPSRSTTSTSSSGNEMSRPPLPCSRTADFGSRDPPEDWLVKAYDGDSMIDVALHGHAHKGGFHGRPLGAFPSATWQGKSSIGRTSC